MTQQSFPEGFLWGTATASYQVEGAVDADGRGKSIWDTFSHTPGKTAHGHTGDVACDQYHRYAEDVSLMRELGVDSYRFSLAWPRIFPEGAGKRNPKGFDYYHRLIDALLEAGIQPCVTLYHWDLPQALEDAGGWPERQTALHYAEYAKTCFEELSDKVKFWITFNEPICTSKLGYFVGCHAPGRKDGAAFFRTAHHLNLAHGLATQAFREGGYEGQIGITLNLASVRPATRRQEDIAAAERARDTESRIFLGPIYGRGYPERFAADFPDWPMPVEQGDMEQIAQKPDFIGLNAYWENPVRHDESGWDNYSIAPSYHDQTEMGWDIIPDGLYRLLKWTYTECDETPIYVTENGAAMDDRLTPDGTRCHDRGRVEFLRTYIGAVAHAIRDGVDVRGYFAWSFIDNFEWAFGYTKRFGLVYCDYTDLRRVPKDSFFFYRDLIAGYEALPADGVPPRLG
ncbi:MAG: GH1 family beta-glucosidase [Phycisphaerae bacterium]